MLLIGTMVIVYADRLPTNPPAGRMASWLTPLTALIQIALEDGGDRILRRGTELLEIEAAE